MSKVQNLGGRIESIRDGILVSTFGVYPCQDAIDRAARAAVALSLASESRGGPVAPSSDSPSMPARPRCDKRITPSPWTTRYGDRKRPC